MNLLKTVVDSVDVRTIIDVAIVSFIFYRLYMLMKGTRAILAIQWLAITLIAFFFAQILHLYTLNWILRNAWFILVIVILLVFQPELRRGFMQLSNRKFLGMFSKETGKSLSEILKAVKILSKKKCGALIVFEMEASLQNYIETGIQLDSEISAELILSVFMPNTPLHDGGVIIREGRIVAAGCLLPLSQDPSISRVYGTRHRAAIGLSEETDAIVIAISEETGAVSMADAGMINPNLNDESLKNMLDEKLGEKKDERMDS